MGWFLEFAWKVISALGGTAAVLLGVVGVAYWLFQAFSERWLQSKFDARLADLQHAHNEQIEQLRFRINALMDRTMKLHEREYQVLPELWEALASSWAETAAFTSPMQSMADVARMTYEQLEEYLARTELFESQKQLVRDSGDRTRTFQKEMYWHRKASVEDQVRKFSRALRFNGIFVPDEIKAKLNAASEIIWDALTEHGFNEELEQRPRERKAQKRLAEEGKVLLDEIEKAIQDRLWSISQLDQPATGSMAAASSS